MIGRMPKVRLRPWRERDAVDIAVMADDDHVRRWSNLADDVEAWLATERAELRGPSRAICRADDDRALGRVALRLPEHASPAVRCAAMRPDDQPAGELSYWVVPEARGHGLARAAVARMLDEIAATMALRSVVLDIEETNAASVRVAEAVGAQRRMPSRVQLDRSRTPRTLVVYVVTLPRPGDARSRPARA